jgi:glutathione S-transferase
VRSLRVSGSNTNSLSTEKEKLVLYDVPVSNNGARIRLLLYKKRLTDVIDIASPMEIGGLQGEEYGRLNPLRKMPCLKLEDGSGLPESQVIESYILDKFSDCSPSLIPSTPESRARASLIVRVLDLYINTIQGALYKPMDSVSERARQITEIAKQLDIIEMYMVGRYCVGEEMSYADTALLPTMIFCHYILPKYFGWPSIFENRPKLKAWWETMNEDEDAVRIVGEVEDGLMAWDKANRWVEKGIVKHVMDESYAWYPN